MTPSENEFDTPELGAFEGNGMKDYGREGRVVILTWERRVLLS